MLAGVGIKCSFPLISSLAFDVSIGTSWVSKKTLLFKVLLIIAAFHSVSFIYLSAFPVLERMSALWVLCHAPNTQHSERETLLCLLLRVAHGHSCLQHSRGAGAFLLPVTLPVVFSSGSL